MPLKMPKLYIKKKCYGVNKWMLENLDDIDLLYEVGVLLSCHEIEHCSCCKHWSKWCLEILINRWDEIRHINFFDAIKIIKQSRFFFTNDFLNRYREGNKQKVQSIVRFYKLTDEPLQAIYENKELFDIFNLNLFLIKEYIYSLVRNTDDSLI